MSWVPLTGSLTNLAIYLSLAVKRNWEQMKSLGHSTLSDVRRAAAPESVPQRKQFVPHQVEV
jgi:hypothetical protein